MTMFCSLCRGLRICSYATGTGRAVFGTQLPSSVLYKEIIQVPSKVRERIRNFELRRVFLPFLRGKSTDVCSIDDRLKLATLSVQLCLQHGGHNAYLRLVFLVDICDTAQMQNNCCMLCAKIHTAHSMVTGSLIRTFF